METVIDNPGSNEKPVEYAGFWLRFVAALIDGVVMDLLIVIPLSMMIDFKNLNPDHLVREIQRMQLHNPLFSLYMIVVPWMYFAILESSSKQATFGKMALGLQVTDLEGKRVTFAKATGRFFSKIVSALTLTYGYMMAGFTPKKQALHDKLSDCLVIKKAGN